MAFEKNENEIGVLFAKESKAKKKYYSGTLNGQEVVGWPRTSSNGTERIEIVKSKPRDQAQPKEESVPAYGDLGEAPF